MRDRRGRAHRLRQPHAARDRRRRRPGGAHAATALDRRAAARRRLVVNIGDCLMRWTNDVYVSTPHRVVNRARASAIPSPSSSTPIRTRWSRRSTPRGGRLVEIRADLCRRLPEAPARREPEEIGAPGRVSGFDGWKGRSEASESVGTGISGPRNGIDGSCGRLLPLCHIAGQNALARVLVTGKPMLQCTITGLKSQTVSRVRTHPWGSARALRAPASPPGTPHCGEQNNTGGVNDDKLKTVLRCDHRAKWTRTRARHSPD